MPKIFLYPLALCFLFIKTRDPVQTHHNTMFPPTNFTDLQGILKKMTFVGGMPNSDHLRELVFMKSAEIYKNPIYAWRWTCYSSSNQLLTLAFEEGVPGVPPGMIGVDRAPTVETILLLAYILTIIFHQDSFVYVLHWILVIVIAWRSFYVTF